LFQISPDLAKAFRRLSTRVNKKKSAKSSALSSDADLVLAHRHSKSADPKDLEQVAPLLSLGDRAFRLLVVVKTTNSKGKTVTVALPAYVSQADQGSDMIVATRALLKALAIPLYPLSGRGFSGLTMHVADGTSAELTHYAVFEIGVRGIWRKIEAFVRPYGGPEELHLLLGMPWLHTVDAKFFIRESVIELGDVKRGEQIVKIQGP
jgi:hypothetical protein